MSWPLVSFSLVVGVLLVGWLAYERSMPSARTVALVATLSALAALGRDAFAALDEVKPITAMAFAIGYAMGPLPGFVVGAIGMLISNMLLGQGPYTPWQMAAWGIVGLLGALAGKLFKGGVSRVPLALGCAFAAFVAKEVMNVYTWSIGGAHTFPAFIATAGSSVTFDAVDVVSTLLFGLAFGPELVALLRRAQARMTVNWERAGAAGVIALLLIGVGVSGVGASSARAASGEAAAAGGGLRANNALIARGVSYLEGAEKADGGFGAESRSESTGMYTAWVAVALASSGKSPLSLRRDGHDLLSVLGADVSSLKDAGDIERTMLALHACGLPAGRLAGDDLLAALMKRRERDGSFEGKVDSTAFAILALRAAGEGASSPVISSAAHWLSAQQNRDGGFNFGVKGGESDVDDTGAAMEALVAAGGSVRNGGHVELELERATKYLRSAQNGDGGFPQMTGEESNAQSTAWAVQGLIAAGTLGDFTGSRSPIAYLEGLVAPNGSVDYAKGNAQTPVWVTAEVVPALAGRALPVGAPRVGASRHRGRDAASHTGLLRERRRGRDAVSQAALPTAQRARRSDLRPLSVAYEADAIAARCLAGMRGLLG